MFQTTLLMAFCRRSLSLFCLSLVLYVTSAQALVTEIIISGQQYQLVLEENTRLKGFASKETQFFKGTVQGIAGSWVRLSKINNSWVGKIYLDDQLYNIDQTPVLAAQVTVPSASPVQTLTAEVLDTSNLAEASCGLSEASHNPEQQEGELNVGSKELLDGLVEGAAIPAPMVKSEGEVRVLDLQLALDHLFVKKNAGRQGAIDRALSYINEVDAIYESHFGISMNVINFDTFETEQDDPITNETAASTVLKDIEDQHLAGRLFQHKSASLKHLITDRAIDSPIVGLAWIGSLCTGYPFSLTRVYGASTSLVIAHEIAHNFGASHDGEEGGNAASCDSGNFIMSPAVSGARSFSECSKSIIQSKVDSSSCIKNTVDVELTGNAETSQVELDHSYQRVLTLTNLSNVEVEGSKVDGSSSDASIVFSQVTAAGTYCTLDSENSSYSCNIATLGANATIEIVESFTAQSYGEPLISAQYFQPTWHVSDITWTNNSVSTQYLVTAELGAIYASYSTERLSGVAPLVLNFDASNSKASSGNTLSSYDWQVSNGDQMVNQAINSYTFTQVGEFTVTLTITDSAGQTDSVVKTIQVLDKPTTEPAIVTNLTAAPIAAGVRLSWHDAESEDNYRLYRRVDSMFGSWAELVSLPQNSTEYLDLTGSSFESYQYYIIASNSAGDSGQSGTVTAKPGSASQQTEALYSLSTVAGDTPLLVNLDATDSLAAAGTTISSYTWVSSNGQVINDGQTSSITYNSAGSFTITLTVTDSEGGTATVQHTVQATEPIVPPTAPQAPSHFSAQSENSYIQLNWQDNSDNETGFEIYRQEVSIFAPAEKKIITLSSNVTEYKDTSAQAGLNYSYRLLAVNEVGSTEADEQVTVIMSSHSPAVAEIELSAEGGLAPITINLSAQNSVPSTDASITSYQWTSSDGQSINEGELSSVTYTQAGSYEITLTVTDSNDYQSISSETIKVTVPDTAGDTHTEAQPEQSKGGGSLSWVMMLLLPFAWLRNRRLRNVEAKK